MRSTINKAVMGALLATSFVGISTPAEAHKSRYRHSHNTQYYGSSYAKRCRTSRGDAGLIAGGVGGALVGKSVLGHGLLGTAAGAVGGAFAGRAVDRTITANRRCTR
jgi:outer membrane lipoprotein SlyB